MNFLRPFYAPDAETVQAAVAEYLRPGHTDETRAQFSTWVIRNRWNGKQCPALAQCWLDWLTNLALRSW